MEHGECGLLGASERAVGQFNVDCKVVSPFRVGAMPWGFAHRVAICHRTVVVVHASDWVVSVV